jgi:hypothetical protein
MICCEKVALDCSSAGVYRYVRAIDRRWLAGSALLEGYGSSVKMYEFHGRRDAYIFIVIQRTGSLLEADIRVQSAFPLRKTTSQRTG